MPASTTKARVPANARYRDPVLERRLKDLDLVAVLEPDVPFTEFDEDASLHNQARLGEVVNEETVETLADKLRDGGELFAILAHAKTDKDRLTVIDGNHRFQAHKRVGRDGINTYVVTGDDNATRRKVEILMYQINAEHGRPTDDETRVQQALNLHDRMGLSVADAAKVVSVSKTKVQRALKLRDASERADRQRINRAAFDKLPPTVRQGLNEKIHDNTVFKEMTTVVLQAGLTVEDVTRATRELQDIRDHDAQLEYVEGVRRAFAPQIVAGKMDGAIKGNGRMPDRTKFLLGLGHITRLPPPEFAQRLTPEDRADLKQRTEAAVKTLTDYLNEL